MRLLVCGSRDWTDRSLVNLRIRDLDPDIVIHGCARGADSIAGHEAELLGISVLEFPANWGRYNRGAGMIRNQQMLDEGRPDFILAFHDNLGESKGTADMVRRAQGRGLKGWVVSHEAVVCLDCSQGDHQADEDSVPDCAVRDCECCCAG